MENVKERIRATIIANEVNVNNPESDPSHMATFLDRVSEREELEKLAELIDSLVKKKHFCELKTILNQLNLDSASPREIIIQYINNQTNYPKYSEATQSHYSTRQVHNQQVFNLDGIKFTNDAILEIGDVKANMKVRHNEPDELITNQEVIGGKPSEGTFSRWKTGKVTLKKEVYSTNRARIAVDIEELARRFFNQTQETYPGIDMTFERNDEHEHQFMLHLEDEVGKATKKEIKNLLISTLTDPIGLDEDYVAFCKAGIRIETENERQTQSLDEIVAAYEACKRSGLAFQ